MVDRLVQAIVLVTDLDTARRRMNAIGLTVLEGGRHPGRGTANLIVPFGRHYLELLTIVDEAEALASPQGRPVVAAWSRHGPGLSRWSVETPDIETTARRVSLPVEQRRRILVDGQTIHWHCVGVDAAWDEPWRCAFMAWDDPDQHPARVVVSHPNGASGFARLDIAVPDSRALLDWLGGAVPEGITVSPVAPDVTLGPTGLFLATPAGDLPIV